MVFLLALACAAPTPSPTPSSIPTLTPRPCAAVTPMNGCTAAPSPPAPLPGPGQELLAGFYTQPDFEPPVSFRVGPGWTTVQQALGFFDIQDDPGSLDVVAVQFTRATGFDTAEEAAADIEGRANLAVGERKTVTVNSFSGGITGIRLVVDTTDAADSDPIIFRPVLNTPAGPLSIGSGRRLQIHLFTISDGVLAILVGGSIAEWSRTVRLSKPVLESTVVAD